MVVVCDVRSRKPVKVFTTDRSRAPLGGMPRSSSMATGNASGLRVVVRGLVELDHART